MQNPTGLLLCLKCVLVYKEKEEEQEEEEKEVVVEGEARVCKLSFTRTKNFHLA